MNTSDIDIEAVHQGRTENKKNIARGIVEDIFIDDRHLGIGESVGILLEGGGLKRDRLRAGLEIVNKMMPPVARAAVRKRFAYSQDKLPFDIGSYELSEKKVGAGGMNDVFLMQSKSQAPSIVLKVLKSSMGESNPKVLLRLVEGQKEDYEKIRTQFERVEGLVPEEYFIVANGPRGGQPAAMAVQYFQPGEIRDAFTEVDRAKVIEIVGRNAFFKQQLKGFLDVIDRNPDLLETELDILGQRNLAVVGEEGEERLLLLDPHSRAKWTRGEETQNAIVGRIDYLKGVLSEVSPD